MDDPTISASQAAALEAATPEILWVSANVHGDEESGADAALQVLYELADRDDCVATTILNAAIVVMRDLKSLTSGTENAMFGSPIPGALWRM